MFSFRGGFSFLRGLNKGNTDFPSQKEPQSDFYWDPCGEWVDPSGFAQMQSDIDQKLKKYQDNPLKPKINFYLLCIPLLLFSVITGTQYDILINTFFGGESDPQGFIGIGALCAMAPLAYRKIIHSLQRDYIKTLLAQKYKWLYNPSDSKTHWQKLAVKFPEILQKGNDNQTMHDEFWGNIKYHHHDTPFYSGVFEYQVVSGHGKNRKKRRYFKTIFAFKLQKSVKADFLLSPENQVTKLFSWSKSKEIQTESEAFNKAFAFTYNGKKDEKAQEIIKTLSPAVQTKLLDLKDLEKYFSILFRGDVVLFATNGKLLPKMKTNFFRKVEVDPQDEAALQARMESIMDMAVQIAQYLN